MIYNQIQPHKDLADYIDAFWTIQGDGNALQKQRILPDGCVDLIFNLGADCKTENRTFSMRSAKTYLIGTMTAAQENFLNAQHKFTGVRFKPSAFPSFFKYPPLNEVTNKTIEFEAPHAPNIYQVEKDAFSYLNAYFLNQIGRQKNHLCIILNEIENTGGQLSVDELIKRNFTTARQLERSFLKYIGITPKEYVKITRFKAAFAQIKHNRQSKSLQEIAFETGYYDHSHLTNDIKRYTGCPPSQL